MDYAKKTFMLEVDLFEKRLIEDLRSRFKQCSYGRIELVLEAGKVNRVENKESLTLTDFLYR